MARASEVRFWRDPELGGLELRYSRYDGRCFSKHTHETYSIGLVEQGRTDSYLRGAPASVEAGQIVLIHPDEVHSCNPVPGSGWTYRMFYLDKAWFRALAVGLSGRPGTYPDFEAPVVVDPPLYHSLIGLGRLVAGGAERLERESAATGVFSELLRRHCSTRSWPDGAGSHAAVLRVQEYIDAHLTDNTSLAELSEIAGLSPYHLLRAFKQRLGLPPHRWRIQRRVHLARRLLASDRPLADVALEAGFADQAHFSSRFRQVVGATPGRYRRG